MITVYLIIFMRHAALKTMQRPIPNFLQVQLIMNVYTCQHFVNAYRDPSNIYILEQIEKPHFE